MSLAGLPSSLRARLRIKDILAHARPVSGNDRLEFYAAIRYLRRLGVRPTTPLLPGALFNEYDLDHWASKSGRWDALLALADDEHGRALHATFLTPDGRLAPIESPRLLLGAPNGACVKLIDFAPGCDTLWLSPNLDLALAEAACPEFEGQAIWSSLSVANLKQVRVPDHAYRVVLALAGGEKASDVAAARGALQAQGKNVVTFTCVGHEEKANA